MVQVQRILCPVDFTDTSRAALRYAIELAARFEAQLTLLHVYQVPGYTFPEGVMVAGPELLNHVTDQVEKVMADWRRDAIAMGAKDPRAETAMGGTEAEIVRVAKEGTYDLIVVGTHGRSGIKHALLGSVAERIVRTAPCPVLTIKEAAGHHGEPATPEH